LGLQDIIGCKKRFHFEAFWPSFDGFLDVVKDAWESVEHRACPLETFALKLKAIARRLQSWSQKKFGHFMSQLLMEKEIVHQFDIAQECRPLQPHELWLRINLKKHSLALSSLLRTMAKAKIKIKLVKGWRCQL
jgi:hypothetical protein